MEKSLKELLLHIDELSSKHIIGILGLGYILIVSLFSVRAHYTFYTNCWDLGIYSQALYSTIKHGKLFFYTAELHGNPSGSLFGIHFTPILFFLTPVYALFSNSITLLVLRPVIISSGLIPLYLIAKRNGIDEKSIVLFAFIYLIYLPVLFPFYNFDVEVFLLPLFFMYLYFLDKKDFKKSYILVVLSLMVNEFVPLITITMPFYIVISNRENIIESLRRRESNVYLIFSVLLVLSSIIWFQLATHVISSFNPTAFDTKWEWGELGSGPFEIVKTLVFEPWKGLRNLSYDFPKKIFYLITLFAPVAFLPVLEPLPLIMAIPWIASSMFSVNPQYYSLETQYPSFFTAFIFYSTVKAYGKLNLILKSFGNVDTQKIITVILLGLNLIMVISLIPIFSPKTDLIHMSRQDSIVHGFLKEIPEDSSISVMPEIFPHVCNRLEAYPYYVEGTDYVLINQDSWWYTVILPRPAHLAGTWENAKISEEYKVILREERVFLMQHVSID